MNSVSKKIKTKVDFSEWNFDVEDIMKKLVQQIAQDLLSEIVSDPFFYVRFGYEKNEKFVKTEELYIRCFFEEGCAIDHNLEKIILENIEYNNPEHDKNIANRLRMLADKIEKGSQELPPRVDPNMIPKW